MKQGQFIDVAHLFKPLDELLIGLLESLSEEDWNKETVAKHWKVKDVVSHLLDGNLRTLSIQRDRYYGDVPPAINSYTELVNWLNELNADWTKASRRISPAVLIFLHKVTGIQVSHYYQSLDLQEKAIFSVAWAGESESYNWMHLAREYTEKWHHQQQIREAVGKEGIMTRAFFYPFIDTFFRALPFTFSTVQAQVGTLVKVEILTSIGGEWYLQKQPDSWCLVDRPAESPESIVEIPPQVAWKLFSKSIRPEHILEKVVINGNAQLGHQVLNMVSVMA